ncbi:hypothetical protein AXG93_1865s1340 [Marchantia polymorpha subsp. ruderalis]|uniref:Transcription factor IIIC 90kDa subunit N-terminal domain-containing protein n=1 Tax=Marchantia polymorpha subsp. ruderalis TaxID=1480154 RepID=A0A176WJC0_MARPO|nr:hypothetical protein AXG93_1865s1340 [Marchantia polymorpha subsp. ruderalis]
MDELTTELEPRSSFYDVLSFDAVGADANRVEAGSGIRGRGEDRMLRESDRVRMCAAEKRTKGHAEVDGGSRRHGTTAVPLVGVPVFPNCIKFSETNLLAVAAGHLVTILNPAALAGPRGFIPITSSPLFDIGKTPSECLQAGSLLPYLLFRDPRPGVRAMDWSPSGLAQNGGCLLALCTTDNRVKIYREPFSDFQSDWVEIIDFSEMAYRHCLDENFRECELLSAQIALKDHSMPTPSDWGLSLKRKHVDEDAGVEEPQHRKVQNRNYGLRHKAVGRMDLMVSSSEPQVVPFDDCAQQGITDQPLSKTLLGKSNATDTVSSDERPWLSTQLSAVMNAPTSTTRTRREGTRLKVLEENAGVCPPVSCSDLDVSNGELLLTLDEPLAEAIPNIHELEYSFTTSNLRDRDQECIHEAGDLAVSVQADDDLSEPLISVLTRTDNHRKVYGRRQAPGGNNLYSNSSYSPSNAPDADTCPVENTSTRPARMRKLPNRFREGGESPWTGKFFPRNKTQAKSRGLDKEKRATFETEKSVVVCVDEETGKQDVGDEGSEDASKYVADSSEEKSEAPKKNSGSKSEKSFNTEPDDKIKIAADYVARSELLSPLALAWSPKCQATKRVDDAEVNKTHTFTLLGAGMKSGAVSIWRMMNPPCYSVDQTHSPVEASFLGFLEAHKSWVTSLCWASCNFDVLKVSMLSSNQFGAVLGGKLLLVTGCADGSVKIWAAHPDSLVSASSKQSPPFAFCKQGSFIAFVSFTLHARVWKADSVPVTSLAIVVLSQASERALLAVGKGSGSLAIYEIMSSGVCHQLCHHDGAHQQTVTGLSWKFDGRCLYTCGQDSLKIWELWKAELRPVSFPDWSAVFPISISPDLCSSDAMQSFFGVALSHNCLALATVRDLDSDVLDQMYQARSQKAVLQMFWLGSTPTETKRNIGSVEGKGMTPSDIARWRVSVVSALQHLEDPKAPLVLWDVMTALSLLRQAVGREVVVGTLSQWLISWTQGEDAVSAVEIPENQARNFERAVSEASCRQLHILNVIYRRILLVHLKPEVINTSTSKYIPPTQIASTVTKEEKLWRKCVYLVEHELRQRLIYLRLCKAVHEEEELKRVGKGILSDTLLAVNWVLENSSSVLPELSKVATQLRRSHRNL